jgi:hypothetical protein
MSVVRWKFFHNIVDNWSFEKEDATVLGLGKFWTKIGTPTVSLNTISSYVKEGGNSQKIIGDASSEGIYQIIDISDRLTNDYTFIFYTHIVTGTLNVIIEALDENDDSVGTLFSDTYTTTSELTKQIETFTAVVSGETITQLRITFSQNGGTAMTVYLDSIIIAETINTEVDINPTTFSYSKTATAKFSPVLDGTEVKIEALDENRRTILEDIQPTWAWVDIDFKNIMENWVGKEFVMITHEDKLFCVEIMKIGIGYIERQDPQIYAIPMELKFSNRF